MLDDAIRAYRARGLRRLVAGVRDLGSAFSQSSRYAKPSEALLTSIERDAKRMPDIAKEEQSRTEGEPWRRKMTFIEARLTATLDQAVHERELARRGEPIPALSDGRAYGATGELEDNLTLVADSLHNAGKLRAKAEHGPCWNVCARSAFEIAELEMRTPAADARNADAFVRHGDAASEGGSRLLLALERVAAAQRRGGQRQCRTLILSMTQGAEDVLAALRCAKHARSGTTPRSASPWTSSRSSKHCKR